MRIRRRRHLLNAALQAGVRSVIESLERRLLLHGLKPDGTPIDDGGADDGPAGAVLIQDYDNGTASYTSSYGTSATAGASLASSPWTTGNKTLLFMRATYSDQPTSDPESAAQAAAEMAAANQFLLDNSFGQTSVTTTVTDLIVLPHPLAYYNVPGGDFTLRDDALAAAKAANPAWDSSLYDFDAVRFAGGPGVYSGQAYVGARGIWLKSSNPGVAEHELGHNFGNWHANSWTPTDPQTIIGPGTNLEYGDPFDVMGPAGGGAQHYNVYYKAALGWIPDANVAHVTTSGTYTLSANDLGSTVDPSLTYAIQIKKDPGAAIGRSYWLGFRQNAGWSTQPWLYNGLEVLWSPFSNAAGSSNGGTELLDTTPSSPGGENDAPLVIGRTFDDDVAGIHFTPIAKHDGVNGAPPTIDVVVNFDNSATDAAPTGTLSASTLNVAAGTAVNFTSTASDPNGDALAYYWDFGDQTFGPNAPAASHAWSTPGQYRVRLTVSDMKGKSFSRSVIVTVGSPASHNTIAGRVLDGNGNPVADVRVHNGLAITDPNYRYAYTDADGRYTLTNVPAGPYTLGASKAGWTFTRADFLNPMNVTGSAAAIANQDFAGVQQLYKVNGRVTLDGSTPVAGALVSDGIHTEPTDSQGAFTMYEPIGSYALTATKPGAPWTFNTKLVTVGFADVNTANIAAIGGYLSGKITGLPAGVTVTITDGLLSTTTSVHEQQGGGGAAFWSFGPVPNGNWELSASAPGYTFYSSGWGNPLQVNGLASNLDFAAVPDDGYAIRGRVTDRGEPLIGAAVTAFDPNYGQLVTLTDSYGNYRFFGLPNSTYNISAWMNGYTFTQSNVPVIINGADSDGPTLTTTNINAAPTVAIAAAPAGGPITTAATPLSVLGADDAPGEAGLKYAWSLISGPAGGTVTFSRSGANSARNTIAAFNMPGTYAVRATITDAGGLSVTSDATLNVVATGTFIVVTPTQLALYPGQQQQFSAIAYDQFGNPLASQPAFTWSVSGAGNSTTISPSGLLTAGASTGQLTVTATSSAASGSANLTVSAASVVGRWVFYNNSFFDGSDPSANDADDAAIAPDKSALLPGQNATFANITSYTRGLNGIAIDISGLANPAALSASDFTFTAGNTATPQLWPAAPSPTAIAVRPGKGVGGSDRIEITWPDGAIANEWLGVTIKATASTGLPAADTFYFGNLPGETGNGAVPSVTVADVAMAKAQQGQSATITSATDFNRSGQITVADVAVAKANVGQSLVVLAPFAGAASDVMTETASADSPSVSPASASASSSTPTSAPTPATRHKHHRTHKSRHAAFSITPIMLPRALRDYLMQ
jgi:hypothetical protein